jgi:hypothetical protein
MGVMTGNAMHTYSKHEYVCIALLHTRTVHKMRKYLKPKHQTFLGEMTNGHQETF